MARRKSYWTHDTRAKASEKQVQYALLYLQIKCLPTDLVTAELKQLGATEEEYSCRVDEWLRAKTKVGLSRLIDHLKSLPTPPREPNEKFGADAEAEWKEREDRLSELGPLYLSGLSIGAIASRTRFGYETVKDKLLASGITLRTKQQQRAANMAAREQTSHCDKERSELLSAVRKVRSA